MIVFYNKPLLRVLVTVIGMLLAYTGYRYATGMEEVLGRQGFLDALAIFGYVSASFLLVLVAEVADSHYVRAFAGLSLGAGMITAWSFLKVDVTKLDGEGGGAFIGAFLFAAAIGASYLLIVITRLVLDKMYLGRPVLSEAARIGQYSGPVEPPPYGEPESPVAVPGDTCPFCGGKFDDEGKCDCSRIEAASQALAAAEAEGTDEPSPVTRLVGIAGAYSGEVFDLPPGEYTLGRSEDCDFSLSGDNQMSRTHAKITVDEDGIASIEDLGSTNGTHVDGRPVTVSTLRPGQAVAVGTTTFKVE